MRLGQLESLIEHVVPIRHIVSFFAAVFVELFNAKQVYLAERRP